MNLFSRSSLLRRPETTVEEPSAGLAAAGGAVLPDPALAALTGEWMIDPAHSRIGFSVRHAMVTTVRGSFPQYESRLYFDGRDPARSFARISVSTASVDTGVEQRDAHLTGRDFLDSARHPRMTFASSAVQLIGKDVYRMTGELTIRSTSRPVVLDLTYIVRHRPVRLRARRVRRDDHHQPVRLGSDVQRQAGGGRRDGEREAPAAVRHRRDSHPVARLTGPGRAGARSDRGLPGRTGARVRAKHPANRRLPSTRGWAALPPPDRAHPR